MLEAAMNLQIGDHIVRDWRREDAAFIARNA